MLPGTFSLDLISNKESRFGEFVCEFLIIMYISEMCEFINLTGDGLTILQDTAIGCF